MSTGSTRHSYIYPSQHRLIKDLPHTLLLPCAPLLSPPLLLCGWKSLHCYFLSFSLITYKLLYPMFHSISLFLSQLFLHGVFLHSTFVSIRLHICTKKEGHLSLLGSVKPLICDTESFDGDFTCFFLLHFFKRRP